MKANTLRLTLLLGLALGFPPPVFSQNSGFDPNVTHGFGSNSVFSDTTGNMYTPLTGGQYMDSRGVYYTPNGMGGYFTSDGRTLTPTGWGFQSSDGTQYFGGTGTNLYHVVGGPNRDNWLLYTPWVRSLRSEARRRTPSAYQRRHPCYCGWHAGYCMVFRRGAQTPHAWYPSSRCTIADCRGNFRDVLVRACEGHWHVWPPRSTR